MTQTPTEKGQFVQFPLHLIYERKDLNRDDKWVLLSIMGKCWTDGPHRLSFREVEALSTVPLSLLSSSHDKKRDIYHEGILDRLARLGDIRIARGKEKNATTGKTKGQPQTYIYINYKKFWQQNVEYYNARKAATLEPYHVEEDHYESVPYTNASVLHTNESVPYTNESVHDAPSKVTTYITDTIDKEDKNTFVPTAQTPEPSCVTLPRDGGASQSEEHEEAGISHSQWLSESVRAEGEDIAPGGGTPTGEPTPVQTPAPPLKGIQPSHHTTDSTTGQALTPRATVPPTIQSTETFTHHPNETSITVIPPPPIHETHGNGEYKKEDKPLLCETAPVHVMLNHFRGWVANTGGEIKNENVVIYELCTLYPLAHFQAFFSYLATNPSETAKWWRERHRKMRVKNLRDLLPEVLSELGLIPKPEEPPSLATLTSPTPLRSYTPWTPHEEIIPRAAVAH